MQKVLAAVLAASVAVLSGCIAPAPNANASAAPVDARVTVAPDLEGDICITDARCAKGNGDFLTFQANVVNNCRSPLAVEWRVQWLDADGMEIESVVSTWNARMIQPHEICALKGTAPRPDAADMRFYVRKAK